jgi:hypothetical protein
MFVPIISRFVLRDTAALVCFLDTRPRASRSEAAEDPGPSPRASRSGPADLINSAPPPFLVVDSRSLRPPNEGLLTAAQWTLQFICTVNIESGAKWLHVLDSEGTFTIEIDTETYRKVDHEEKSRGAGKS